MQNRLNFTTSLYKRKIEAWGYVNKAENGSSIGDGIVGDLFHQKVDLVVASVALNYRRVPFIDYLPPLNFEISSIFIPESYEIEMADVNTFLDPLHKNTWLAVPC